MNDTSWRNLSALLGLACVVLIIAAGALLATSGESASPTPSGISAASANPSDTGSDSTDTPGPTASASPTAAHPSPTPTGGPTATSTPPANAPIAQVTFNNLMLDSSTDTNGTKRTFTIVTDGPGPLGITITKSAPATAVTLICAKLDDAAPTCYTGTRVNFKGASTDTAHSVLVVTLIGNHAAKPTVDLSLSWPSFAPKVTLTHGRLQGSKSPNVPAALNGITATFKPAVAGNVALSASWTAVTADVQVSTLGVNGPSTNLLDQKTFTATNLGASGYSFGIDAGKTYQVTLRNLSADSMRPDLTAVLSIP